MAAGAEEAQPAPASQRLHRQPNHVDLGSTARAKVALFRSLFRGRDDLYARRFESATTGKSGYAPACANEWVRGICRKPRIKCADCAHRAFLPLTDQATRISPARGPPLWDDCDVQAGKGVDVEPDWDVSGQIAPDYPVDQRIAW